ncbi:hypothetical protein CCMA1212_000921 [Trichoderma ghanense]|uniref:Uncharacterized protein n=1 Tax=Trichoderma ghanense TaxID=65468 RepID=A0ABY2HGQ0_9HYPO
MGGSRVLCGAVYAVESFVKDDPTAITTPPSKNNGNDENPKGEKWSLEVLVFDYYTEKKGIVKPGAGTRGADNKTPGRSRLVQQQQLEPRPPPERLRSPVSAGLAAANGASTAKLGTSRCEPAIRSPGPSL